MLFWCLVAQTFCPLIRKTQRTSHWKISKLSSNPAYDFISTWRQHASTSRIECLIVKVHPVFDAWSLCLGTEQSTSISRMSLAVWSPEAWCLPQSICNTGGIFLPADFLFASLGIQPACEVGQAYWWRRLTEMKTSGEGRLWSDSAPVVHSSMFCGKALRVPAERLDRAVIRHHRLCLKCRALCLLLQTNSRCPKTVGFPSRGSVMLEKSRTVEAYVLSHFFFTKG